MRTLGPVTQRDTSTTGGTAASVAVVEAVANAEGVDPTALSPPLYHVIPTDALNELIATTVTTDRPTIRVTFAYHGYEITVRNDSHVTLTELSE